MHTQTQLSQHSRKISGRLCVDGSSGSQRRHSNNGSLVRLFSRFAHHKCKCLCKTADASRIDFRVGSPKSSHESQIDARKSERRRKQKSSVESRRFLRCTINSKKWSVVILCIVSEKRFLDCFGFLPGHGVVVVVLHNLALVANGSVHDFGIHLLEMRRLAAIQNNIRMLCVDLRHFRSSLLKCILFCVEVVGIGQELQKLSMGFLKSHFKSIVKRFRIKVPLRNHCKGVLNSNLHRTFGKRFQVFGRRHNGAILKIIAGLPQQICVQLVHNRFGVKRSVPRHLFTDFVQKKNHQHTTKQMGRSKLARKSKSKAQRSLLKKSLKRQKRLREQQRKALIEMTIPRG